MRHTRTSPTERYPRDEVNTNSMPDPDEDSKATSPHNMNSTEWLTLEELESEKQKDDIEVFRWVGEQRKEDTKQLWSRSIRMDRGKKRKDK